MQNYYNLLNREEERETLSLCLSEGIEAITAEAVSAVGATPLLGRRRPADAPDRRADRGSRDPRRKGQVRDPGPPLSGATVEDDADSASWRKSARSTCWRTPWPGPRRLLRGPPRLEPGAPAGFSFYPDQETYRWLGRRRRRCHIRPAPGGARTAAAKPRRAAAPPPPDRRRHRRRAGRPAGRDPAPQAAAAGGLDRGNAASWQRLAFAGCLGWTWRRCPIELPAPAPGGRPTSTTSSSYAAADAMRCASI